MSPRSGKPVSGSLLIGSFLTLFLLLGPTFSIGQTVRVALQKSASVVKIDSEGTLQAFLAGEADPLPLGVVRQVEVRVSSKGFFVSGKPYYRPSVRIVSDRKTFRFNGKEFDGAIEVFKNAKGSLLVVNDVDLEEYLKGVVPNEMPNDWPAEALKAQAVASRSYALYMRSERMGEPYYMESGYLDQVYKGKEVETPETDRAVEETLGVVVAYEGKVAQTLYHSTSGGKTESFADVYRGKRPYLLSVTCPYDRSSPHSAWQRNIDLPTIQRQLNRGGYRVGPITQFSILALSPTGRVKVLYIEYRMGTKTYTLRISGQDFRRVMGFDMIRSTWFQIGRHGQGILFRGHGFGHGVGMCQWGAKGMADQGKSYQEILLFYYPNTSVVKNYGRPEEVTATREEPSEPPPEPTPES